MIKVLRIISTLKEIKSLFFNTVYLWTIAFISPMVISHHDFLVLFALTRK
jgi:hypothetical protein